MSVDYGKALNRGLSFAIKPKRWLQFFFMDLAFFAIALTVVFPSLPEVVSLFAGTVDVLGIPALSGAFIYLMILFALWMLVRLWFIGAIVQQSYKEKEKIADAYRLSGKRYLHVLLSIIIVTVVLGLIGAIPYVGWLITIVLGWAFFFVLQGVIVSRLNFWDTIMNSYTVFRKNPMQVFLAWLLIMIVTLVIYFIFSIPLIVMFFGIIGSLSPALLAAGQPLPAELVTSIVQAFQTNLPALMVVGVIALAGFAISQVFSLKAQTEFYLQLKKKK